MITGAADDDPSGIATYTQTGAQFGYGQLWTAILMLPLQTAIQEACARIGAVTGKGLAHVVKDNFNKYILYSVVLLVLVANTINIGADIGAMAAAFNLLVPLPFTVTVLMFTALILVLEVFMSYRNYARVLKWLCVTLFSYTITLFLVRQPWWTILKATFLPHIDFNFAFFFIITGVLGTTISPYMFFWQASEEVEEERERHMIARNGKPRLTKKFIHDLRLDTFLGMLFSELGTWSIIVVAATVLHGNGLTDIQTTADAARALEPLVHSFPYAGMMAKALFAVGVIGLGLLGIPVLSASASYAVSEAMSWKEGLNMKFKKAHGFYGVITVATIIGLIINFVGINPIKALVFAAVFNGVAAVPLIFVIAKTAQSKKIMGVNSSGGLSRTLVWLTFVVMGLSAVAMFITLGKM